MRIFALETSVEKLKAKFISENEEAVHVSHKHFLIFFMHSFWQSFVTVLVLGVALLGTAQGWFSFEGAAIALVVWAVIYLYFLWGAYIDWKYNFIIVTTQKMILVQQRSFFYQRINPIHFGNINSTRVESQFGGIFRCGTVYILLKISEEGGKHVELASAYVPKPNNIAAMIEHGIVMNEKPIKPHEEQQKKDAMQEATIAEGNPKPDVLPEQQGELPPATMPYPPSPPPAA